MVSEAAEWAACCEPARRPLRLEIFSRTKSADFLESRARRYTFVDANTFEEVFEVAEPGKDFQVYSRATLRGVATAK